MTATRPQRLFTVDEYERMIETGILCEGERVELLEGLILRMAAMGTEHSASVNGLQEWFDEHLPRTASARVQLPIRLPPRAEPEPDIAIVRRRPDRYRGRHPQPEDSLLLIEVADSSLGSDRELKLPRYAEAGIPEAWLWDLVHERVMVCRSPCDGAYQEITFVERGGVVTPLTFPDLHLPVDEIFW